ncbi:DJ-1/PfpI family protein [Corynebacterium kroppenstedtii]|jgi:putative thiJ/pfpI family protein|uniref:DJ-1/PfpI family protein n=1 Tax=Corynebacterium kroppenstedtii TaxID=161879 RepID=A0A2W5T1D4_9CORY|nr:DJ-1/PfpI family protein [Corynebacterium kroppenstedtii]MDU7286973.1 DJ-1/PfpI family protein [Corynebacterium kroppenstedtii]PZR05746.1 MAG: DJ-1/PfpI family protein [Corynebacterium kroppenstedtii]
MAENVVERHLAVLLFDGFELLDAFGPIELFSAVPGVKIELLAARIGPVRSAQGIEVIAELEYGDLNEPDIIFVPGGRGTRSLAQDNSFLSWLMDIGSRSEIVASVCTGSALLAAAGLLEGHRATSNKLAFGWASSFSDDISWEYQARWVHDGCRWTSSGVAAGMDMTAALIGHLFGQKVQTEVTKRVEYQPQTDSTIDPFARFQGSC